MNPDLSQMSDADLMHLHDQLANAPASPTPAPDPAAAPDLSKLSDADLLRLHDQLAGPQAPQEPGKGEAFLRGGSQGATLGFGDELSGALSAAIPTATDKAMGRGFMDRYRMNRDDIRASNAAAEKAHGGYYLGGQIAGGVLPSVLPLGGANLAMKGVQAGAPLAATQSMMNLATIGGANAALYGLGSNDKDLTQSPQNILPVAKQTLDQGLMGAASTPFMVGGANLTAQGIQKLKLLSGPSSVKNAFAKLRGISRETLDSYLDPESRGKIDKIATDFDSLNDGQRINAERVANDIQSKRSDFIQNRTDNIANILNAEQAADRPISIQGLLDQIENEKSGLLPVGSANKKALGGLDEIRKDLLNLASQNQKPINTNFTRYIQGGEGEAPTLNGFTKNATDYGGPELSYLPAGDEIISKKPGGPKEMNYAFTNQAGDVKEVDPIMGPLYNRRAKNLIAQKPDGTKLQSALDVPESLMEFQRAQTDPFVTPIQLNKLRQTFNDEAKAAYTGNVGQRLPGANSVASLGDMTRNELDNISPQIRSENSMISDLYGAEAGLKSAGLNKEEIDPARLRELLTAGPKRASNDTPYIQQLDQLLGTNVIGERQIARGAQELNPEGLWNKIKTGYSTYPLVAGALGASTAGAMHSPGMALASGLTGAAVAGFQSPALTKPLIRLGSAIGQYGGPAMDSINQAIQNNPTALGKFAGVLSNAASRGQDDLSSTHFVLMQSNPEYRDMLKNQ